MPASPTPAQKRDFIAELKDYAKRPPFASGNTANDWARLRDLARLHRAMDTLNPDSLLRKETAKHMVVSMATLVQANVRRTLAEIIDAKDQRGERIPELAHLGLSLSTELARELRDQSFSVGKFVARFLKLGTVERISEAFQEVTGKSFEANLRPVFKSLVPANTPPNESDKRLHQILRRLAPLFTHRRILCNEEGNEVKIEPAEVDGYVEDVMQLVPAITGVRYGEAG